MENDTEKYEALAAWAESDAPTIRPGAVIRHGSPELHAEMAAMLAEVVADDPESAAALERVTGGRPTLAAGAPAGDSPAWRVRVPRTLDEAVRARAAAEGRKISAVVREAVEEYMARHAV